jgi:hypothetical protein
MAFPTVYEVEVEINRNYFTGSRDFPENDILIPIFLGNHSLEFVLVVAKGD